MYKISDQDLRIFLDFAHKLADISRVHTLKYFRQLPIVDNKLDGGGFDPVTKADKEAEYAMREVIEDHYPDHSINGEEFGIKNSTSDWTWFLDPVDGTRAFIAGLPSWGTLVGLAYKDAPVLGIIDQPFIGERFCGSKLGSTLNSSPIWTRPCSGLSNSIITTTDPDLFNEMETPVFQAIKENSKLIRYSLDCYGYAVMAAGHIDVVLEAGLKAYDMMALAPVIKGAGGMITDWHGAPINAASSGQILAAGDKVLHAKILQLIGDTLSKNGIIAS